MFKKGDKVRAIKNIEGSFHGVEISKGQELEVISVTGAGWLALGINRHYYDSADFELVSAVAENSEVSAIPDWREVIKNGPILIKFVDLEGLCVVWDQRNLIFPESNVAEMLEDSYSGEMPGHQTMDDVEFILIDWFGPGGHKYVPCPLPCRCDIVSLMKQGCSCEGR